MPDRYRLRKIKVGASDSLPLSSSTLQSVLNSYKGSTFNRMLALLSAVHSSVGLQVPKIARKPEPQGRTRWLTAEQWKKLRKVLVVKSPLLADCADFSLATGLRENNVLNLEWSQIDLRRRVAWIYADQVKTRDSIGVPLNDAAMAVLERRRGIDKRYVFGNPDYPLYKASNRAWYEALREAKMVGFRWHDLRHTWAAWHVMNGTRIEELQRLGGWKTLAMVQRYAHLASEHLAGVAANVKPVSLRYNASKRAKKATDTA
jgi:integrase